MGSQTYFSEIPEKLPLHARVTMRAVVIGIKASWDQENSMLKLSMFASYINGIFISMLSSIPPPSLSLPPSLLQLDFDKCFYEHESTKTLPELFTIVGRIYKYVKLIVYHFFVLFLGIPMALFWAIFNGFMVFLYVWLWQPILRLSTMWLYAVSPLASVPLQAFFAPLIDVSARIFRQIRVKATLDGPFAERLAGQASTRAENSV
jgi:hypothetical protein